KVKALMQGCPFGILSSILTIPKFLINLNFPFSPTSKLLIIKLVEEVFQISPVIKVIVVLYFGEVIQKSLVFPEPEIGRYSSNAVLCIFKSKHKFIESGPLGSVSEIWRGHHMESRHYIVRPDIFV